MVRFRAAAMLLALALSSAGLTGCLWDWFGSEEATTSAPAQMAGPEARQALTRARKLLYGENKEQLKLAVRLADSVITHAAQPQDVWAGYLVKASAYRLDGRDDHAAESAREGIQSVLSAPAEQRTGDALRALKMLLSVYAECAIRSGDRGEVLESLNAWRDELRAWRAGAGGPEAADDESINAQFDLLCQIAEEYVAARPDEVEIRAAVSRYASLFNTRNTPDLAALFAPGSPVAEGLAREGVKSLCSDPANTDYVYLASSIAVIARDDGTASATCEMVATSPAGWARTISGVTFNFKRQNDGWLIESIENRP